MPSKAYGKFLKNLDTVTRLEHTFEIVRTNRNTRGRAAWDHLTRSAIVFLVSSFEVYIEDVINETIAVHIRYSNNAQNLPGSIKDSLNKYVKNERNGTPPTALCDEGWRSIYRKIGTEKTEKLNTPKVRNLSDNFRDLLGMTQAFWSRIESIHKLDEIIIFRGEIVHRVQSDQYVNIDKVKESKEIISVIVKSVDNETLRFLKEVYPNKRAIWNVTN